MSEEDMEEELARSGWKPKPGDSEPVTTLVGIEDTARTMDANFIQRVEQEGAKPSQVIEEARKKKTSLLRETAA